MERFVLAGKAKQVFEMIELMARGEENRKKQEREDLEKRLMLENSRRLWPVSN